MSQDKEEVRVRSGRKQVFVLRAEKPVIEEEAPSKVTPGRVTTKRRVGEIVILEEDPIGVSIRPVTAVLRAQKAASEEEDPIKTSPSPPRPVTAKRRVYHNEIERQRRNKINTWITELGKLVPEEDSESPPSSKVQILERACQYVEDIKEKNGKVTKELRQVTCENRLLKHENEKLKKQLNEKVK